MSIELKNVTYTYSQGTAYESHALKDIKSCNSGWTVHWCDRSYWKRKINLDPAF